MRRLPLDIRQVRILTAFLFSTSVLGFAAGQQLGHLVRSPDRARRGQAEQIRTQQAPSISSRHVTGQPSGSAKQVQLVHVTLTPTPTAAPAQTPPAAQAQGMGQGNRASEHSDKPHGKAKDHAHPKAAGRTDSGPKNHATGSSAGSSSRPNHDGHGHGEKHDGKNT